MPLTDADIKTLRAVLSGLDPKSSASASKPLPTEELYAPAAHMNALDPNRPLVVGNRGVGKSVWSAVLADEGSRHAVAPIYPRINLDRMSVELGFHEDAGKVGGVAPSPKILESLLSKGKDTEEIWTAVLLRAVAAKVGVSLPDTLLKTVEWSSENIELAEAAIRKADEFFARKGVTFVLVFDALDRLGTDWTKIRPLTEGVLRLALGMQGYKAMRAKVFMRTDQAKDEALFRFPDASKMRAARVDLAWHSTELYGLLFRTLQTKSPDQFNQLVKAALGIITTKAIEKPEDQKAVFDLLAGEFMGSDPRRGRTYTWLVDHLSDAFHETTPRSFLVTLQRAANARAKPAITVIDHHGIREGVQEASEIRVNQLEEDYPWIRTVLESLAGLEVPCPPASFVKRWKDRGTVRGVDSITKSRRRPGPIELQNSGSDKETALLEALKSIGVIEGRSEDRINMPDIFRVAAKIKRRGGVRPPGSTRL
jgi:hypothetical protein